MSDAIRSANGHSVDRVRNQYAFSEFIELRVAGKSDVLERISNLTFPKYESLIDIVAARLSTIEQIAPCKWNLDLGIRDEPRETEVILANGELAQSDDRRSVVGGFFRHFDLPLSFEVQSIYEQESGKSGSPTREAADVR